MFREITWVSSDYNLSNDERKSFKKKSLKMGKMSLETVKFTGLVFVYNIGNKIYIAFDILLNSMPLLTRSKYANSANVFNFYKILLLNSSVIMRPREISY